MSRIVDLWRLGMAPSVSALCRADGSAYRARVDGADLSHFQIGEAFDLDAHLAAEPEDVTYIDECARATLPDGSGYVCCGDGAHGSEGFFARIDLQANLLWIVFLHNGNPFHRIGIYNSVVTFVNNLERTLSVDLTDHMYE